MPCITALQAVIDPLRHDRAPAVVAARGSSLIATIKELLAIDTRRNSQVANVDLALGAPTTAAGIIPGAAEAIFLAARNGCSIGHAIEK